jgi:hypothetical protein
VAPTPGATERGIGTVTLLGIIAAVIVVIAMSVFFLNRRRIR